MANSGESISFSQLSARSNQCAGWLRSQGIKRGDRIALFMENRPEFIEISWAGINSGLFFTPISTHLKPAEIAFILNDCDARVLFASEQTLAQLPDISRCPSLERIISVGETNAPDSEYRQLIAAHTESPSSGEVRGAPMMYSSGTTGRPKGILPIAEEVSPEEPTPLAKLLTSLYSFSSQTIYLSPAPLYHTAPLKFSLAVMGMGGTAVICERFDAATALSFIERYRVTHSQWVPTMFSRFLKLPENIRNRYDYTSQQVVIHAAAPCPLRVKRAMIDWWGPILYEYYGGSESIGLCAISPQEFELHPGSVGRAVKGKPHILDEFGNEMPRGETGTIYFEGGGTFSYHKDPERTRAAHTEAGWNTLGDLGYLDDEGYLYLSERRQDLIISGGVNIYPREAEDLLIEHPDVADVAVFGIPNQEYGEEVKACVQLVDPSTACDSMERALIEYCEHSLSRIKCPRSIDFLDELPRHPNGKLLKRELKERCSKPGV